MTATGTGEYSIAPPTPSSPDSLSPHAITVPFASSARLWRAPAEIARTPDSPWTATGTALSLVPPSPSWPTPPAPHATTVPSASSARLWRPPAATAVTNCRPLTGTGSGEYSSAKPSPSCRYVLSPHATAPKRLVATVSVATRLVALPAELVNTARYSRPLSAAVGLSTFTRSAPAPAIGLHVTPPLDELSHWIVGAGKPDAAASKNVLSPSSIVELDGCSVTSGTACTVNVAAALVTLPAGLVNVARNWWPSSAIVGLEIVSCGETAPSTALQLTPASVETSHCTLGAGKPDAVASSTALWPSSTTTLDGWCVTAGAFCTVSVAAALTASPSTFLNAARYSCPLSADVVVAIVNALDVPPATADHVLPPLDELSHLTVGAGEPDADASNVALCPSSTVKLTGCWTIAGAFWTVNVAALLVACPATLRYTARNCSPLSDSFALAIVSMPALAPSIGLHVAPAFVDASHCTVGAGVPDADELNVALCPSSTVKLAGCLVTLGAFVVSAAARAANGAANSATAHTSSGSVRRTDIPSSSPLCKRSPVERSARPSAPSNGTRPRAACHALAVFDQLLIARTAANRPNERAARSSVWRGLASFAS